MNLQNKSIFLVGVTALLLILNLVNLSATINVTLNYPISNESYYDGSNIIFNGTIKTSADNFSNASLWTNENGTWALRDTISNFESLENDTHGRNMGVVGSTAGTFGLQFKVSKEMKLYRVQKGGGNTATRSQIYYANNDSLITSTTTLSGGYFIYNNLTLNPTKEYKLIMDDSGASYNYSLTPSPDSFPVVDNNLNITDGISSGLSSFLRIGNIKAIQFLIESSNNTTVEFERNFTNSPIIWNIQACDFDGDCNFSNLNKSWSYKIFQNDLNYTQEIPELSSNNFTLNITYDSSEWSSITGILNYNEINYSATSTLGSGDNIQLIRILNAPSVSTDENKTFYWIIRLTNSTGTYFFNSNEYNQTVENINIDDCSSYSTEIFKLLYKDEETQELINFSGNRTGAIEIDISIYGFFGSSENINYSNNFANDNNVSICIDSSLTNNSLYLDADIKYYSDDYSIEKYNIRRFNLNSSSISKSITLYGLNTSKATIFDIFFKGDNFNSVPDALIDITRQYVSEGVFKTVERPITDADGKTTASLVKDTGTYTFYVYKEGVLLATFQNIVPICENDLTEQCTINLNAVSTTTSIDDFETIDDVNYDITYNETTRTITLDFTSISGDPVTMELNSILSNAYENETVCSDSLLSSSGTLNCIIPETYLNSTVIVTVLKDDEFISRYLISLEQDPTEYFGMTGMFMGLIMMIVIPFMFITSLIGMVVGMVIGLIALSILLLSTDASIFSITGGIIWGIIAAGVLIWKLNEGGSR